jgi:ArsR family transcriptional regulator, lead/cadmium/zinc/bismuth-responsive transcriptional repressor
MEVREPRRQETCNASGCRAGAGANPTSGPPPNSGKEGRRGSGTVMASTNVRWRFCMALSATVEMYPTPATEGRSAKPASARLRVLRWRRSLLSPAQAGEPARTFKVLASDSRLRLLHALARAEELCVGDLAAEVSMTPQAVPNQLQRLIDRRIVASRREGNHVVYWIVDPCVAALLELGLCTAEDAGARDAVPRRQRWLS